MTSENTYTLTDSDVKQFLVNVKEKYGSAIHDPLSLTAARRLAGRKLIPGGLFLIMRELIYDHERGVDEYDDSLDIPQVKNISVIIKPDDYPLLWSGVPENFIKKADKNVQDMTAKDVCNIQ